MAQYAAQSPNSVIVVGRASLMCSRWSRGKSIHKPHASPLTPRNGKMGKEQPKRYSDKLQISGDADGDPIKHAITTIRRIIVDPRSEKGAAEV